MIAMDHTVAAGGALRDAPYEDPRLAACWQLAWGSDRTRRLRASPSWLWRERQAIRDGLHASRLRGHCGAVHPGSAGRSWLAAPGTGRSRPRVRAYGCPADDHRPPGWL